LFVREQRAVHRVSTPEEFESLYDSKIATMEGEKSSYNQGDATGFIRLNALRLKVRAALKDTRK
jgi:argininosuccinate synthase